MEDNVHRNARLGTSVLISAGWYKAFKSAEHQAKVFASAFLINETIAETLSSAEEIAIQFGISLQSATIFYSGLTERRNRDQTAKKIDTMARQFRESIESSGPIAEYLPDTCTTCGNQTVLPVGVKYRCHTCNSVFDRPDGDFDGI